MTHCFLFVFVCKSALYLVPFKKLLMTRSAQKGWKAFLVVTERYNAKVSPFDFMTQILYRWSANTFHYHLLFTVIQMH